MKKIVKGISVFLFCALCVNLSFGAERIPEKIRHIRPDGVFTYTINKLGESDLDETEKLIVSILRNHEFKNITLARYTSEDYDEGNQIHYRIPPIDVICVDYENDYGIFDRWRALYKELLKNNKISRLDEETLIDQVRELYKYNIKFLDYDIAGEIKGVLASADRMRGAREIALLLKDNSIIIFYHSRYIEVPLKELIEQINTS